MSGGRYSTAPVVDESDDMVARSMSLHARAEKLVECGKLPKNYRIECKTLADLRKLVEAAEKPTPPICDLHGRVASHATQAGMAETRRPEGADLGRYGF